MTPVGVRGLHRKSINTLTNIREEDKDDSDSQSSSMKMKPHISLGSSDDDEANLI